MSFTTEAEFETALIEILQNKGWEKTVLKNPSEADLLRNWAGILFDNNVTLPLPPSFAIEIVSLSLQKKK